MSTVVKAWCGCGWHGEYRSEAVAAYARRRHSCEKNRAERAKLRARLEREKAHEYVERPCLCKEANHVHGTRVKYVIDRCHCKPCTEASRVAEKARRRDRAYGLTSYVDALPATAHVRALMAAGMGWKRVAAAAGIDNSLVYPLLYGRADRNGGAPRTKARRRTVDALLAVPFPTLDDIAAGALVPAAGTTRRLRALHAVGWSVLAISERSKIEHQALNSAINGERERLTAGTARAVRAAYDELWDEPPPSATKWERIAASRSRRTAAARGWPMPLDLDDETVDDPTAPEPIRGGVQGARSSFDLDEWLHLVKAGEDQERAAARLGVSFGYVRKQAAALDRADALFLLDERADTLRALRDRSAS